MSKRQFVFQDGTSDKFWAIDINGPEFVVNFGRSGTTGQTQTKSFSTPEAAQTAADKLIAEKIKKGYLEPAPNDGVSPISPTGTSPERSLKSSHTPQPKTKPRSGNTVPPAASAPAAGTDLPENKLNLSDLDWAIATWRPRKVLPKPTTQPFDYEAALAKASRVMDEEGYWTYRKAHLKPPFGKEEAHFWLTVVGTHPTNEEVYRNQTQRKARPCNCSKPRNLTASLPLKKF